MGRTGSANFQDQIGLAVGRPSRPNPGVLHGGQGEARVRVALQGRGLRARHFWCIVWESQWRQGLSLSATLFSLQFYP